MTTPREDRALIWIMRRNRFLSSSRIRVELIRWTGCRSRRPARCPRLTHDHRRRRRTWARRHRNWNHQHWSDVIFAYESRFSLYHRDGRVRVRRCVGERLVDCCTQETDVNIGFFFMLWGAFHASGKSELVVVDGTVNQERYIGILRQNFSSLG